MAGKEGEVFYHFTNQMLTDNEKQAMIGMGIGGGHGSRQGEEVEKR